MSLMKQRKKKNTFTRTRRANFCSLKKFTEGLCTRHNQVNGLSGKIEGVAGNSSYDDYFKIARRTTRVTAKKDGKTWFPKLVDVVLLLLPDIASVDEGVKCRDEEVELTSGEFPQQ